MSTIRNPFLLSVVLGVALAGCQSTPSSIPPPPRQPEMLSSAPLAIDDSCAVEGAVLVEYTVLQSGRTANVEVESAPECARRALNAWVNSYRYVPQSFDVPARFEWILVSAKRGS